MGLFKNSVYLVRGSMPHQSDWGILSVEVHLVLIKNNEDCKGKWIKK